MNAIIVTTINKYENLYTVHERCPGWTPIVVGDLKTPHEENRKICKDVDGIYLDPETQMKLGFTHAAAIPWNCYGRKNIGYLFALKEGAQLFYITDDDNIPAEDWSKHVKLGRQKLSVLCSSNSWYNCYYGADTDKNVKITPRGFPTWLINDPADYKTRLDNVNVGVIAGLHLGSPDVDAATRMTLDPFVKSFPEEEVALEKGTMCPYDSQNTILIRELMPANMLWSYPDVPWTRYDDIFAGYVGQIIAMKYGYSVRFGRPFCVQERNPHDIVKDLYLEMNGMRIQKEYFEILRNIELVGDSPVDDLQIIIHTLLKKVSMLPEWLKIHVDTWAYDIKKIGL